MSKYLWTEHYRPKSVSEYVFRDEKQKKQVQSWLDSGAIPHLLFSGAAGTGKTTLAKVLLHELDVDWGDVLFINASVENGVDEIRNRINDFATTIPFGDFKYAILDECLHEDTQVWVLRNGEEISIPIKEVKPEKDLVKSYNVEQNRTEWKPFQLFDKGVQNTLEIEFEDGSVVICTPEQKWYVEDENGNTQIVKAESLINFGHILSK